MNKVLKNTLLCALTFPLYSCIVLLPITEKENDTATKINNSDVFIPPTTQQEASPLTPKTTSNLWVRYYMSQLKDNKDTTRTAAASYLGMMGNQAKAAIPDLIICLKDSSKYVRRAAAKALGRMGQTASIALPQLKVTTNDSDPWVAHSAKNAIKKISS